VPVGFHPDGSPIRVPYLILAGERDGPVLLITAAVHGPEVGGYEVIRRLVREVIDPGHLSGMVVALPCANPLAVRYDSYYVLEDGLNLNRVFPGSCADSITPRLADTIFREFVLPADAVVDLHANPEPALEFCIVKMTGDQQVQDRALHMAGAFGITVLAMTSKYEKHRTGTMIEAAMMAGKPSVIVELVGWRRALPASVDVAVTGLLNLLVYLEMLPSSYARAVTPRRIADGLLNRIDVLCQAGGFALPRVPVGDAVQQGQVLVEILDPFGDVVERVCSPRDGWVVAYPWSLNQFVGTGEAVAFVAFRE
jgi:predicted deacylase